MKEKLTYNHISANREYVDVVLEKNGLKMFLIKIYNNKDIQKYIVNEPNNPFKNIPKNGIFESNIEI